MLVSKTSYSNVLYTFVHTAQFSIVSATTDTVLKCLLHCVLDYSNVAFTLKSDCTKLWLTSVNRR